MLALYAYCRLWFWTKAEEFVIQVRTPVSAKKRRAQQFAGKHLEKV
jgi:hypothetical protein